MIPHIHSYSDTLEINPCAIVFHFFDPESQSYGHITSGYSSKYRLFPSLDRRLISQNAFVGIARHEGLFRLWNGLAATLGHTLPSSAM